MREYLLGPRQSGRTHNFIMSLPAPLDENDIIYVVSHSFSHGMEIKKMAEKLRGKYVADSIRPLSLESFETQYRGIDAFSIFFEHTAYEQANAKQYRSICMIEDLQEKMWMK